MILSRRLGGVCLCLLLSTAFAEPPAARRFVVPPELAGAPAPTPTPAPVSAVAPEAAAAVEPLKRQPALPLQADPAKSGYAFEEPAVLVRQLIFGLAHGVTLLARACLDDQEEVRRPTQIAYHEWLMRHGDRIIDAEKTLAHYYFGERADSASEDDIARALNLPPQLELRDKPEQLREACASFPEALSRQRYDLDLVFSTHRDEQRLGRALELRELLAQCRQIAEVEALPAIDAATARWQEANAKVENAARERWLRLRGEAKDFERWQEDVRSRVRRSFTSAATDPKAYCTSLIDGLDRPENSLAHLVGDASTAAETEPIEPGKQTNE